MIAIIDYGAGNLFSVKNALDFLGLENKITNSAADLSAADRLTPVSYTHLTLPTIA